MDRSSLQSRTAWSYILRYGLAVASSSIALGLALLAQHYNFRNTEVPLFLFTVALTAWYGGSWPAALALVLSIAFFDYFFTEPRYTLYVTAADLPYLLVFTAFASLVAWFSAVRRRIERELRQARDHLQIEVSERTQQADLLNLTHDTIFVRDKQKSEGELRKTRADGTQVVVASRWSLRRDDQGRAVAILETNNDITERKRREQEIQGLNVELAKRSAELEAINKELESFAYSISHDLRAPLRHMSGFTELLQKKAAAVLDEKSNRYIVMILDSAKRMGDLIDDLLAFSRIGRTETQKTSVSLAQLAREAVTEVRQDAEGRNIAWKIGARPMKRLDAPSMT